MRILPDKSFIYMNKKDRFTNPQFKEGLNFFLEYAALNPKRMKDGRIFCPCKKCGNRYLFQQEVVEEHVFVNGFETAYRTWTYHGEGIVDETGNKGIDRYQYAQAVRQILELQEQQTRTQEQYARFQEQFVRSQEEIRLLREEMQRRDERMQAELDFLRSAIMELRQPHSSYYTPPPPTQQYPPYQLQTSYKQYEVFLAWQRSQGGGGGGSMDADTTECREKLKNYRAAYARRLKAKFFSKKIFNGGDVFDLETTVDETSVDNEVIKSSRWPCTRSFANPTQAVEDPNGSTSSVAGTSGTPSKKSSTKMSC